MKLVACRDETWAVFASSSSQTVVDTRRIVGCVPADVTWQQHCNWEPSLSDSLWDRCLLIAKFRSAFCSCCVAKSYDRPRSAADLSPLPDESTVHISLTQWYRLHTHSSVKYLAVHTRWCHWVCFDVWPWCLSLILRVCYMYEVLDSFQHWSLDSVQSLWYCFPVCYTLKVLTLSLIRLTAVLTDRMFEVLQGDYHRTCG